MKSINCKVNGVTQPGFKLACSGLEPARFRFPDLSACETDTLLILVGINSVWGKKVGTCVSDNKNGSALKEEAVSGRIVKG